MSQAAAPHFLCSYRRLRRIGPDTVLTVGACRSRIELATAQAKLLSMLAMWLTLLPGRVAGGQLPSPSWGPAALGDCRARLGL